MASLRLGSKSEAFHREGQTWVCTSGLPSDITIEVGDTSFHLHKFPLLSRSGLLEKLIEEYNSLHQEEATSSSCTLKLNDLPGGAKALELVAKFCYGVRTELSASTIVSLRCASEYLQMTEEFEEGNLVSVTEAFLNEVFASWPDSLKALETCEEVQPSAEDLNIVSRCIDSLATKASSNPSSNMIDFRPNHDLVNDMKITTSLWNGLSNPKPNPDSNNNPTSDSVAGDEWWFNDVSCLSLPLYKRLILAMESKGLSPNTISSSIIHYAKKYLPLMTAQTISNDVINPMAGPTIPETDQRALLEELVLLLPNKKGVTSSKTLLRLLRIAMMLHATPNCLENLEKRVGAQLDQALLVDLLIPNMGYSVETLYDIDCVQRILDNFMAIDLLADHQHDHQEQVLTNGGQVVVSEVTNEGVTAVTSVANLIDGYLAEVAVDVNLKLPKFEALAAVIPDYVRPGDDGIYKAVDVYLKAHPWLTDAEREQLCRLMNCQKLSLEASTHAAQNERLPLRVIVQVLFFEQLRLRTSISGWFFVSSSDAAQNIGLFPKNDDDVRLKVLEIEKECSNLRMEIQKLVKTKKKSSWSLFPKRFGFRKRSSSSDHYQESNPATTNTPELSLDGNVDNNHRGSNVDVVL